MRFLIFSNMKFSEYPFLKYLLFLTCGIVIGDQFFAYSWYFVVVSILSGLAFGVSFGLGRKWTVSASILSYVFLCFFGAFLGAQNRFSFESHEAVDLSGIQGYIGRVLQDDISKPNSFENVIEIVLLKDQEGWHSYRSKVLVYHQNATPLISNTSVWISGNPEGIPDAQFPHEFDYKGFLAKKGIFYRQFLRQNLKVLPLQNELQLGDWIGQFRRKLSDLITSHVSIPESRQIAKALLLGEKSELDRDTKEAYAQTGTMHILAVSGLHVGIIYAILLFPLRYIRLGSKPKILYLLLVLGIIWLYAALTGFSLSVIRAASMFSLFTLGDMRKRKPSSWNLWAFSAMLILVLDPGALWEVGFQLSYAAVAGILAINPLLVHLWIPKSKILDYFWQLATVSVSAQLATFPLSIFYFHLFPSYFLPANLLVIPLSFLAMMGGILLLIVGWIPGLGMVFGGFVNYVLYGQNLITQFIQQLPGATWERLTISILGMMVVWTGISVVCHWRFGDRKLLLTLWFVLIFGWSVVRIYLEVKRPSEEWILFTTEKGTLFQVRWGEKALVFNPSFPTDQIPFAVDPYRIAQEIEAFPASLKLQQVGEYVKIPGTSVRFDAQRWRFERVEVQKFGVSNPEQD